jgi:hypothetical protein
MANCSLSEHRYACCAPELLKGEHSKNVGQIDSWASFSRWAWLPGITPFFSFWVPLWMFSSRAILHPQPSSVISSPVVSPNCCGKRACQTA